VGNTRGHEVNKLEFGQESIDGLRIRFKKKKEKKKKRKKNAADENCLPIEGFKTPITGK
jgi:hypothetical protein